MMTMVRQIGILILDDVSLWSRRRLLHHRIAAAAAAAVVDE
jgi:hypothetical protein